MPNRAYREDDTYTEYHVRPGVFVWSPQATHERREVSRRKKEAATASRRAQGLIGRGLFAEAEAELEQAVASQPDKALYVAELATCISLHRQHHERSLPWFDEAIKLGGGDAGMFTGRARALAQLGRLHDAEADLAAAAALAPGDGRLTFLRGTAAQAGGDYTCAIRLYTAALEQLTQAAAPVFEVLTNRGICLRCEAARDPRAADRCIEASVDDLGRASALDLVNLPCRLSLGTSLARLGRLKKALETFENCVRLAPADEASHNDFGLALLDVATQPAKVRAPRPLR